MQSDYVHANGQNYNCLPLFDVQYFSYRWSQCGVLDKMCIDIIEKCSLKYKENNVKLQSYGLDWLSNEDCEIIKLNALAFNFRHCQLSHVEYNRISACTYVKDIWEWLISTHEGTLKWVLDQTKIDLESIIEPERFLQWQEWFTLCSYISLCKDFLLCQATLCAGVVYLLFVRSIQFKLTKRLVSKRNKTHNYSGSADFAYVHSHPIRMVIINENCRHPKNAIRCPRLYQPIRKNQNTSPFDVFKLKFLGSGANKRESNRRGDNFPK